jgi:predicted dehydrogenase
MSTDKTVKIRWGILGTGNIAHLQTRDLLANRFEVAAVGSRSQGSASDFAREFDIPRSHGSYEDLVSDPEVDVVYISTPHPFHAEHAMLALNAGKHVLVEKPFALNAAQARRVVELASANYLVALEAMWTRWLPHMKRVREIVADGTLGDVRTVIADHNKKLSSDPAHRLHNPQLGGGALLDLGIYPVSFAWDILGAPTSISAHAAKTETGVDRQTAMIFGYEGGQQAVLHCALDAAGPTSAAIIGTAGWIKFDTDWYKPSGFTVYDSGQNVVERFDRPVLSRGMQYQAWEAERRITEGPGDNAVLPPGESIAIMGSLDEIRRQIGLAYPGE